jgi:hypothetical protein
MILATPSFIARARTAHPATLDELRGDLFGLSAAFAG